MPRRNVEFCVGEYYHIYNRGAGKQPIFFEADNYRFFLAKLKQFVAGKALGTKAAADVVAYC